MVGIKYSPLSTALPYPLGFLSGRLLYALIRGRIHKIDWLETMVIFAVLLIMSYWVKHREQAA